MKKDRSKYLSSISHWRIPVFAFLLFTFYFAAPSEAAAHRYHTSLTRIDYNAEKKLIEITIQLFTHDLIPVLERKQRKSIDLEKTPEIDKIILEYLNVTFVIRDKNVKALKLNWVGKELETDSAFIYVEIPSDENLESMTLENRIFFETFAEQTNLVVARIGERKADFLFKPGDKSKTFNFNAAREK